MKQKKPMLQRSRGKINKRCSSARERWRLRSNKPNMIAKWRLPSKKLRRLYETRNCVSFRVTQPHIILPVAPT
jgi:hypothetical protein